MSYREYFIGPFESFSFAVPYYHFPRKIRLIKYYFINRMPIISIPELVNFSVTG